MRAFDRAHAIVPANASVLACQAAACTLRGDHAAAGELLASFGSRKRVAAALMNYYSLIRDFEKAAEWAEKALIQRDGTVSFLLQFPVNRGLRLSPHWPRLAKMLNLPA